jgi:hypothetical protein
MLLCWWLWLLVTMLSIWALTHSLVIAVDHYIFLTLTRFENLSDFSHSCGIPLRVVSVWLVAKTHEGISKCACIWSLTHIKVRLVTAIRVRKILISLGFLKHLKFSCQFGIVWGTLRYWRWMHTLLIELLLFNMSLQTKRRVTRRWRFV